MLFFILFNAVGGCCLQLTLETEVEVLPEGKRL